MDKEDERDREWKAFLDKHKEEIEFADRLAEYLNKKYENYLEYLNKKHFGKEKYGASVLRIDDKIKLRIYASFWYDLPWITIFNEKLTVGFPQFRSTKHALEPFFSLQKYDTFLNILEEIKNKENWEKYKNDDMFGDEISLYERADEIANEVNKKYGTNIVFRGGYDCWFETTFSIKDKSLEEVIKEIERNIPALYEASEKACKIVATIYNLDFIFNKPVSKRTAKQIEKLQRVGVYLENISVILRYKLKYLPIILATSVHGPQKVGEGVPFPFGFGKFKWAWSEEDQRVFEELKSKVETRIEKREWRWAPYKGEQTHVFWNSKVLELKEVEEEIEKIRRGKLLSSDDEKDVELLKDEEVVRIYEKKLKTKNISEDEKIKSLAEIINEDVKVQIDRFCENINKVKDKVRADFYFGLVLLSEEVAAQLKELKEIN